MYLCDRPPSSRGKPTLTDLRLPSRFRIASGSCLLPIVLLVAGCQPPGESSPEIALTWQVAPDPPRIGRTTVTVTLADSLGRPVRGARVTLEGTMTHPGMQPVLAEAHEVAPGQYAAPLDLTMGGDWMLLLHASLPDGRSVQRQQELRGVRAP